MRRAACCERLRLHGDSGNLHSTPTAQQRLGIVDDDTIDEVREELALEWQLGRVGGYPLTHKRQLKTDGSVETVPVPPIVSAALRLTREFQKARRTEKWPKACICGERHQLLFTTATGQPLVS